MEGLFYLLSGIAGVIIGDLFGKSSTVKKRKRERPARCLLTACLPIWGHWQLVSALSLRGLGICWREYGAYP